MGKTEEDSPYVRILRAGPYFLKISYNSPLSWTQVQMPIGRGFHWGGAHQAHWLHRSAKSVGLVLPRH